jgi:hypothetical protein
MTKRATLRDKLIEVVRKHEAGQNHNEGAFDADCNICIILADLRRILSNAELTGSNK